MAAGQRRKAVWVDFGGVLTPPVDETFVRFCRRLGLSPQEVGAAMVAVANAYDTDDVMKPLDTPLITQRDWQEQVERALYEATGWIADLSDFTEQWFTDRPANVELVAYLRRVRKRGHFVGLLSNMLPSFESYWRAMLPPDGLFDDLVLSYRVGVRKPQRAMYELAAGRAGVAPADCVLVDDLRQNCDGAVAAGWSAVLFTGTSQALSELDAFLGGVPPPLQARVKRLVGLRLHGLRGLAAGRLPRRLLRAAKRVVD